MKLIAFRPQDEADIKDLLAAYRGQLDVEYVLSEFATVADANDPRWGKLEAWLKEQQTNSSSRSNGASGTPIEFFGRFCAEIKDLGPLRNLQRID